MDLQFWNLFWNTGMPEAWLMSRGGAGPYRPEQEPDGGREPDGPLAAPVGLSSFSPGGPGRLY